MRVTSTGVLSRLSWRLMWSLASIQGCLLLRKRSALVLSMWSLTGKACAFLLSSQSVGLRFKERLDSLFWCLEQQKKGLLQIGRLAEFELANLLILPSFFFQRLEEGQEVLHWELDMFCGSSQRHWRCPASACWAPSATCQEPWCWASWVATMCCYWRTTSSSSQY